MKWTIAINITNPIERCVRSALRFNFYPEKIFIEVVGGLPMHLYKHFLPGSRFSNAILFGFLSLSSTQSLSANANTLQFLFIKFFTVVMKYKHALHSKTFLQTFYLYYFVSMYIKCTQRKRARRVYSQKMPGENVTYSCVIFHLTLRCVQLAHFGVNGNMPILN